MRVFARLYFRYRLRGAERIPNETCLFIGNHSGIGIADVLCLMGASTDAFAERRVMSMMHDIFINTPVVGHISRSFGAVPANRAAAIEALARGDDVMAFPGGNLDSCRPWTEMRRVVFGPRRGYIKLAFAAGVPIVPMATIGSHYTYLLLGVGDTIARLIRLNRWSRDDRLPLPFALLLVIAAVVGASVGSLAWWWILVFTCVLLVPNPVRITTQILEPIDVVALTADIDDPDERIERAHELVFSALSDAVATMQHG